MMTVGTQVFYNDDGIVRPAIVTQVWGQDCANLHVFGDTNNPFPTSVLRDPNVSGPIQQLFFRAGPFIE